MNRLSKAKDILFSLLSLQPDEGGASKDIDDAKKRRRRLILLGIATLFILGTSAQLIFKGERVDIPLANNLLVLFLLNINILLLLVMAVLVGRNLIKLFFERRSQAFAPRLQTKLVASFAALTLIPSILLFIVASGLITNSIDNWFNVTVEKSLEDSLEVAENLYSRAEQGVSEKAGSIVFMIKEKQMLKDENSIFLKNSLRRKLGEYRVQVAVVFDQDFNEIASAGKSGQSGITPRNIDETRMELLKKGETITETNITEDGAQVLSLAPIRNSSGELIGTLFLLDTIDRSLVEKINRITETFDEYKQLKLQKFPIKAVYEVTLLLVTLIILFGSIWYGFYLARDITVPIHQLAEATQKVTEGDLTVRLEEKSDDEIGFLMKSFNRMTEQLEISGQKVDSTHKELVEMNMEIDRRRKYIETILAKIDTGVISIDNRGRISTCNPAAFSILKIKDSEPTGKYYEEVFESLHLEAIRGLIREMGKSEHDSLEKEMQLLIDDVQITIMVHISNLKDAAGKFLGVAIVFDDLTAVINAKKTSAWREIAQHMAHEIKNPLTPIRLNAERLRRKFSQDPEDFKEIFDNATNVIIQEVEVLQKLVDEFSRFGQLPEANPEMIPLHNVIDSVVRLFKDLKPDVHIKTNFDPTIGLVKIDKEQMRRAIRNLVENAVDAVDMKGTVEIQTLLDSESNRIHIDIVDDGPGIDIRDHDKVFLPYFSAKKKGTGLGLAIVNRIVADHEGHIRIKNRSPRGTVMAIDIPLK